MDDEAKFVVVWPRINQNLIVASTPKKKVCESEWCFGEEWVVEAIRLMAGLRWCSIKYNTMYYFHLSQQNF